MPSRVATTAAPAAKRFELPALDLNFGSITDGTNIPPPPASPVHKAPTPPKTPPPVEKDTAKNGDDKAVKAAEKPAVVANGNLAGTKRRADDEPVSPAASSRPGSLRRLFSRTMLNHNYTEGQLASNGNGNGTSVDGRPASRSGGSILDDRKSKRSSGWFRRLRSSDVPSRRSSVLTFEEKPGTAKSTGPPPPMIPELKELEKDEGGFGGDLFKNIK